MATLSFPGKNDRMVNESRRALVKKKNDKIIKFHRQIHINIGVIIFGVILIYVIFHVFSFLTSKNITVYEVNEGTIAENQEYQALAIRQEQIVTAPVAGDISILRRISAGQGYAPASVPSTPPARLPMS